MTSGIGCSVFDFNFLATNGTELLDLAHELMLLVHGNDVVGATNAHAINHDVGNGCAAGHFAQFLLDVFAQRMDIKLDDKGLGRNVVGM